MGYTQWQVQRASYIRVQKIPTHFWRNMKQVGTGCQGGKYYLFLI